jgi:hypothetical protein
MSILNNIAYFQNRRDEVPNQELARELAEFKNEAGIREIAENLWHKNQNVQSDCLKVLYEIGYLNPELIAPYAADFVKLLWHKNNRLVWGSMIALSTIAELKADELYPHAEEIKQVMAHGSVITVDAGVKTLAGIASQNDDYNQALFPYLIQHLQTCRSKEIPQHSEKTLVAVNAANKETFIATLEGRMAEMTPPQVARVKKVIKEAQKR